MKVNCKMDVMKSIFCLAVLAGVVFNFFGCNISEGYRLTGELEGVAEGSRVSLTLTGTHRDEKQEVETTVKDGRFVLTGQLPGPRLYLLSIEEPTGASGKYVLMLENSDITFMAKKGKLSNEKFLMLDQVRVEGSATDDMYRKKMAFRDKLERMYNDYQAKNAEISKRIAEARKSNDHDALAKLMQSDAYKVLEQDERHFFTTVEKTTMDAVKADGDSFWGPLLLLRNRNYFIPNDTSMQKIYNDFSEEAKNSFYGQALEKQLFVKSLKGKNVPSFVLPDRDEKDFSDIELRRDKKCVLIDFWASWCNPCRKSIPVLKEVYKEFADKGLEIISISIDKRNEDWQKALDEEQFPWPGLIDTKNVSKEKFDVRAVPSFFLVDENGVVAEDHLSIQDIRSKVKELLQ